MRCIPCLVPLNDETAEWLGKKKDWRAISSANMKSSAQPWTTIAKPSLCSKSSLTITQPMKPLMKCCLEMKLRSNHYQEHVRAGNSRSANSTARANFNAFTIDNAILI